MPQNLVLAEDNNPPASGSGNVEEIPEATEVQLRWQEGQLRCIAAMLTLDQQTGPETRAAADAAAKFAQENKQKADDEDIKKKKALDAETNPAQQPQPTPLEYWTRKAEELSRELALKIQQEEEAWRSFAEATKNRRRKKAGARRDKIEEERWNTEKELKAALANAKAARKEEQNLEAALTMFRPPSPPPVITSQGETMTLSRYHASRAVLVEEVN